MGMEYELLNFWTFRNTL